MKRFRILCTILASVLANSACFGSTSLIVSVPEQKLAVIKDGERIASFSISTSRFGLGDNLGSYATPLGRFEVADKIGSGLKPGSVLKKRHATGEVLAPNAPGRDPIVSRILHLRGMESCNANAFGRGIYIHGTTVEKTIGKPDSYGCIRMRSADVIRLFEMVETGADVMIVNERFGRSAAYYAAMHPPTQVAEKLAKETPAAHSKEATTVAKAHAHVPTSFSSHEIASTASVPKGARVDGNSHHKMNKPAVEILGALPHAEAEISQGDGKRSGVVLGGLTF